MKKQLLSLSLSTALSTALLTTFLPTTTLQASLVATSSSNDGMGESVVVKTVNPLSVSRDIGIVFDQDTLPSDREYVIHNSILESLQSYFTMTTVEFSNKKAEFTFRPSNDGGDDELVIDLKKGQTFSRDEEEVVDSLRISLKKWVEERNSFVKKYFQYRATARDVTLLEAASSRYTGERYKLMGRSESLDTALDATYTRVMSQIVNQTVKNALRAMPPITEDFKTRRDGLWIALAAATLPEDQRSDEITSTVKGNTLKQTAFEAVYRGLILSNEVFSALIANLTSKVHGLPYSPNRDYQNLLGAEAVLAMRTSQLSLVDPDAVTALFEKNAQALTFEQKTFAESKIRNERDHRLLATNLVPRKLLRAQDRLLAKVALTDDEADAYGNAGSDADKKKAIVATAKARILEEARAKARTTSGVPELTDTEADNWNYYKEPGYEAKQANVVALAKVRVLKEAEAEAAALELKRTQAREASGLKLTDAEADAYAAAEVSGQPAIVATAKARIEKEEVELAALRKQAQQEEEARLAKEASDLAEKRTALRGKLGIVGLTDEDLDNVMAAAGDVAKTAIVDAALKRLLAEEAATSSKAE